MKAILSRALQGGAVVSAPKVVPTIRLGEDIL